MDGPDFSVKALFLQDDLAAEKELHPSGNQMLYGIV
jgi:hypothetical protein